MTLSEEDLQERFRRFKALQQQIERVAEHTQALNQRNEELRISVSAIQQVEKAEANNEFLSPIADGIFLKGKIMDTSHFIVNVGANVTVEKTGKEVIFLLEKQKEELQLRIIEAESILQELNSQALKIYKEVQGQQ